MAASATKKILSQLTGIGIGEFNVSVKSGKTTYTFTGEVYIIDIDEEVLHRKIVKLVIQPLVENAIYHGIKYLDGKGMLLILGEIRDGKVVITIRDNGVGMDEETLKHILEKKPEPKEKQRKKTSHVGVYNVQNRLQLYYGKEYGLVYESMPGMGTGVSVIIPAEGGEES